MPIHIEPNAEDCTLFSILVNGFFSEQVLVNKIMPHRAKEIDEQYRTRHPEDGVPGAGRVSIILLLTSLIIASTITNLWRAAVLQVI